MRRALSLEGLLLHRWHSLLDMPRYAAAWHQADILEEPQELQRWLFFHVAGRKVGASRQLTEVRNPRKREKLHIIARRYEIPPEEFVEVCRRLARWWPLLP